MTLFRDPRDYQILFLSSFLLLGIITRDWTVQTNLVFLTITTCLITQFILSLIDSFFKKKPLENQSLFADLKILFQIGNNSWRSALITSLGLCLLLRANDFTTMIIASSLAIGSKFIFRVGNKHFFNPANFGIIAALTLTQDAWISPGQWGSDWWYLLLFVGMGGIILKWVGRWDTSAVFFLTYSLLETSRNLWLGWSLDVLQHRLMSGSLLIFALFMLTDPRSIPNATSSRIIWAIMIAIFAFVLQHQFYLSTAIFWALFSLSPITIILDKLWQEPLFSWQKVLRLNIN
jgi:Na+-transporting NADH:ubiquinone oxidoreductase subunit NqrB